MNAVAAINADLARRTQRGDFREALYALQITCASCGGRAVDHGRDGECYRLRRTEKRHGQLPSLR